jgi:RND family efflux transporter MFP subunit
MTTRLLPFLLVLALAGCFGEPAKPEEPIRPVRAQKALPESAAVAMRLPGEVKPRHESRAAFRVSGKMVARLVEVGESVKPGQTLARLEPSDFRLATQAQEAAVSAAKTDLDLAALELGRVAALRRNEVSSQAEHDRRKAVADASRAKLAAAEAQLKQIRNQAAYATLSADFDAIVTGVDAEAGQVVTAGQSVIRLARPEEKEVVVAVPESRLAEFKSAKALAITVAARPGKSWTGSLRELSPNADAVTRTFIARIALPADPDGPALGMSATVAVTEEAGPPRIRLPLSALYGRNGTMSVWVVDENKKVRKIDIVTDGLDGNFVRVAGGLQGGETVVTAGANLLREGQTVRLLETRP